VWEALAYFRRRTCCASRHPKMFFCHIVGSIVVSFFYWNDTCRLWWSGLSLTNIFFSLSSPKNYNVTLFLLIFQFKFLFFLFFIFVLNHFIKILFVCNLSLNFNLLNIIFFNLTFIIMISILKQACSSWSQFFAQIQKKISSARKEPRETMLVIC